MKKPAGEPVFCTVAFGKQQNGGVGGYEQLIGRIVNQDFLHDVFVEDLPLGDPRGFHGCLWKGVFRLSDVDQNLKNVAIVSASVQNEHFWLVAVPQPINFFPGQGDQSELSAAALEQRPVVDGSDGLFHQGVSLQPRHQLGVHVLCPVGALVRSVVFDDVLVPLYSWLKPLRPAMLASKSFCHLCQNPFSQNQRRLNSELLFKTFFPIRTIKHLFCDKLYRIFFSASIFSAI